MRRGPCDIVAERRGVYDFSTVRMRVADLFDRDTVEESTEQKAQFTVVPRDVPVHAAAPMSELPGTVRVARGLFEDPALFAGVRPYQRGDALRRVHWKATARLQRPVSRRFDPVNERDVVIAMDAQTLPGPFWIMQYDDDLVEGLCVTAMSLARCLIGAGVACGLTVNAYTTQTDSALGVRRPELGVAPDRAHRRSTRRHQPLAIPALRAASCTTSAAASRRRRASSRSARATPTTTSSCSGGWPLRAATFASRRTAGMRRR